MAEQVRHRLGSAVQFVDAFTSTPVRVPLDVRVETLPAVLGMPRLPWRAVRGPGDDTYRFLVTNETVAPVGNVDVRVDAPGREYASFEPFALALPRPLTAHPPTPARSDFLVQHALWPTRSLRLPPGETAIVRPCAAPGPRRSRASRSRSGRTGSRSPRSPYAYTSDAGELVYRLPDLKTVVGGVVSADGVAAHRPASCRRRTRRRSCRPRSATTRGPSWACRSPSASARWRGSRSICLSRGRATMPEYLSPGVFIEEIPARLKAIEGVSTSTAGFVGEAERGPVPGGFPQNGTTVMGTSNGFVVARDEAPQLVTSFAEYQRAFGCAGGRPHGRRLPGPRRARLLRQRRPEQYVVATKPGQQDSVSKKNPPPPPPKKKK